MDAWSTIHIAVQYGAHVTPEDVVRLVNENGGATISRDWRIVGGGWLVGTDGNEMKVNDLDAMVVHSYMETNQPAFMGLWRNPETGTIFLDSIQVIDDKLAAIEFGIANNQLAIYNDLLEEEVDLRHWYPNIGLASVRASVRTAGDSWTSVGELGSYTLQVQKARGWAASQAEMVAPAQEGWAALSSVRLGASVQENAQATIEDLMGTGQYSKAGTRKPPRADIQKMKNLRDLHEAAAFELGPLRGDIDNEDKIQAARDEWTEKYGLTDREQKVLTLYKYFMTLHGNKTYDNSEESFQTTVKALSSGASTQIISDTPFNVETEEEAKKELGKAIKKYEQQNLPMLYNSIQRALDDAYRQGPLESYKLWPKMVQWVKDAYQKWLWNTNDTYNRPNQSPALPTPHIVDVTNAAGAVLSQLRAENRLPQNFDVNKLNFKDFEKWFMEWKAENRASEAQGEVVYEFHDGWTIQKLTTPEQLQFEGDEMGHCVGDYQWPVGEGKTIIYSLRDKKGEPHVTMEVEALEGPRNIWQDGDEIPEDVAYNHEYIHPHDSEPGWHRQEKMMSDGSYDYVPTGDAAFKVVQVQGNSNLTPKPEYQRKIKEFLDSLRAKGWKFERSSEWYPNDDAREEDGEVSLRDNADHGYGYGYQRNLARNLDKWYDDHYKPNNGAYRGGEGMEDAYGMQRSPMKLNVSNWTDLLHDALGALVDDYDPGRWRGRWQDLAQAVWHAWHVEKDYKHHDEKNRKAEADGFQKELDKADEKLNEWVDNTWDYAYQHQQGEIYDQIEKLAEKEGRWTEIIKQVDAQYGEDAWGAGNYNEAELIAWVREHDEDLYLAAEDAVRDEVADGYAGDAYKFLQYLNMLLGKTGLVQPHELPDPQQTNGGLPSYEELEAMPWKAEENTPTDTIPGTFSHWHEAAAPIDPADIQIYPIDQERNIWLDEDGNEVKRFRPGWVKSPETGKMEQTGEMEDTFLDRKGRQGQGYAAYHGDRPVASLTYVDDPAGWYMLGTAYTHPDYREQGLFNRLVQPLRDSGRPIDAYHWNNPWLKNKVRGWQMQKQAEYELGGHNDPNVNIVRPDKVIDVPPASNEDVWEQQRRADEELKAQISAPKIHWVPNLSAYEYSRRNAPDYGLPFLYHQDTNSVWLGEYPTFHQDIEREADVPYYSSHGRYNHLRHQPSEHYTGMWNGLPPAVQQAVENAIIERHPNKEIFDEPESDGGWDDVF